MDAHLAPGDTSAPTNAHLVDSVVFGHQWSTPESRELFAEPQRVRRWITVVKALAIAQADHGVIPRSSADAIAALDAGAVSIDEIGERTRRTGHSTLGLIEVLQHHLPDSAREHVYYGATVQDVSDTAAGLEIDAMCRLLRRDLLSIEETLLELAERHRRTPMLGRTHGQPGAPITFGFKAACWADEVGRSLTRLHVGHDGWCVVQLAGAVGALGFYDDRGTQVRDRFAELVGLDAPAISWTASRDRLADFGAVVAIATTSLARLANEVRQLQREEIGELAERTPPGTVGSITMPHKRNPESSEQIVALARLARSAAHALADSMVGEHERDGATWKMEWLLLPELGHHALAAHAMARSLIEGLEVGEERMAENLSRFGAPGSQELLRRMSERVGKHRAQRDLGAHYERARRGVETAGRLDEVAEADELAGLEVPSVGSAPEMVSAVVDAARARRAAESDRWT